MKTDPIRNIDSPPAFDSPVVDPATISGDRLQFLPRYGDATWSFHYLSENPSATNDLIRWDRFPIPHREPMRHAAWALVNFELPASDLARHGSAMRPRLSAGRIYRTIRDWRMFAEWLFDRGIAVLSDVTTDEMTEYSMFLCKRGLNRNTVVNHLIALTRLHSFGALRLPPEHQLVEPPWLGGGIDEYLPAASSKSENMTEPITPETLGALLTWSLRLVEDFAEDILLAHEKRTRILTVSREATDAVNGKRDNLIRLLNELRTQGKPIPVNTRYSLNDGGGTAFAGVFLSGLTGTSVHIVRNTLREPEWREYVTENPGPCSLDIPIRGVVDGKPWHSGIEMDDVPKLVRHLVDSCYIVLGYLTGMRPGEILGLEQGCCPEPPTFSGAPARYVIHGRQFKHSRDDDGNHFSGGTIRDAPWVAVPQVVSAIRVLERLVGPGRLLFDAVAHDPRNRTERDGKAMVTTTIANRIERTVLWFNQLAEAHDRASEIIPSDPAGRIGVARFRRTLAWHIARRPGGLVALAVQYGHVRTTVTEGYAGRGRGGIHDLMDFETARAVAEHLSDVHEAIQSGEGISGPAARHLINAATQQENRFGGMITTIRQARSLLADPTLTVFDNPDAYLSCNYDPAKALCHPDRGGKRDTPSLDRCVSTCANVARTDTHVRSLEQASANLLQQARSSLVPVPIADRLRTRAVSLAELAKRHHADRITPVENSQ